MTPPRYRMGVKVSDTDPRHLALKLMRDMKRVLLELVRTWDVPSTVVESDGLELRTRTEQHWEPGVGLVERQIEYHHRVYVDRARRPDECPENDPEEWLALWRSAIHLCDSADRLAAFCKQEHDRTAGGDREQ